MGGGNPSAAENSSQQNAQMQTQLGQQQMSLSQQYADLAKGELGRRTTLEQPLINFQNAITSGNQNALLTAMGAQLGAVAQQSKQAQSNIYNTVAPGAGRDYALAQTQQGQGSQIAQMINSAFTGALTGQAQLGAEALGAGLQEQGATLSGAAGATSSLGASNQAYAQIQQTEAQKQATKMNFLGSLVGAAGEAAGGGAFGKLSDARLKEDVEKIGEIGDVNLYSFRYKWDPEPQIGVVAQEVYQNHPEAVEVGGEDPSISPWKVRYDRLLAELADGKS